MSEPSSRPGFVIDIGRINLAALVGIGALPLLAAPMAAHAGAPTLSVGNTSVTEADATRVQAKVAVSLSDPGSRTITVDYATSDDRATAGEDYTTRLGRLEFAPGRTKKQIRVPVLGDVLDEPQEQFVVTLSNPRRATFSDSEAVGKIKDNDPLPVIDMDDADLAEGTSGTSAAELSAELTPASGKRVSFAYATANGSANAGQDYTAANGTIIFDSGETTQTIPITLIGDYDDEPDETFAISLSNPRNATLAISEATATILDDDLACVAADPFAGASNLGSLNGDGASGFPSQPDRTIHQVAVRSDQISPCGDVDWFKFMLLESSNVEMYLSAEIKLESTANDSPNQGDVDLCVYSNPAMTTGSRCSQNGPGVTEIVNVCVADGFGGDDSRDFHIRAYGSGNAVSQYTLTVTGNVDLTGKTYLGC